MTIGKTPVKELTRNCIVCKKTFHLHGTLSAVRRKLKRPRYAKTCSHNCSILYLKRDRRTSRKPTFQQIDYNTETNSWHKQTIEVNQQ